MSNYRLYLRQYYIIVTTLLLWLENWSYKMLRVLRYASRTFSPCTVMVLYNWTNCFWLEECTLCVFSWLAQSEVDSLVAADALSQTLQRRRLVAALICIFICTFFNKVSPYSLDVLVYVSWDLSYWKCALVVVCDFTLLCFCLTRVKPNIFSYMGTKDKRAITVQEIAVLK